MTRVLSVGNLKLLVHHTESVKKCPWLQDVNELQLENFTLELFPRFVLEKNRYL